jgi:hypothetical protein
MTPFPMTPFPMTPFSMTLSPAVTRRRYGLHTASLDALPARSTAFTTMPSTPAAGTSTVDWAMATSR